MKCKNCSLAVYNNEFQISNHLLLSQHKLIRCWLEAKTIPHSNSHNCNNCKNVNRKEVINIWNNIQQVFWNLSSITKNIKKSSNAVPIGKTIILVEFWISVNFLPHGCHTFQLLSGFAGWCRGIQWLKEDRISDSRCVLFQCILHFLLTDNQQGCKIRQTDRHTQLNHHSSSNYDNSATINSKIHVHPPRSATLLWWLSLVLQRHGTDMLHFTSTNVLVNLQTLMPISASQPFIYSFTAVHGFKAISCNLWLHSGMWLVPKWYNSLPTLKVM